MKYEFTIEELNCFTITLEVEPQDDPDLEEDAAWEQFNNLKSRWHDHSTCIEHDTHCDIQVSKMEKQNESDT